MTVSVCGDKGEGIMRYAALRCCASCEWIWRDPDPEKPGCPQCGFGSYGARWVHGDKAYRYATTQKPWLDKKMAKYERELLREIATHRGPVPPATSI